ncbi:MAG: O-antigen ligase family protein [Verrucomicrobiota bacterium]
MTVSPALGMLGGLMDRKVLDRWCERGVLGLALGILVAMPLAFGGRPQRPVAGGCFLDFWLLDPFLLAEWLMVPLVGLWVGRLWLNPKPRLLWPPICWAVIAFVLYAIGRYLTADIEYVARQELLRILVYGLLFFAIVNNLHRQEATQVISLTLIFLGMLISFYAAYQFLAGSDRVWHVVKPYPHRGSGTYICPNHLAGLLEMLVPLGLAYTLIGRFKPLSKVFLGYASLAMLAGIAVTASRGGWASTLVALVLFFGVLVVDRTYRLPSLGLLVLLVGTGLYLVPRSEVFQTRARQLFIDGQLQDDARFALWRPALRVWQENVWWGAGPAHYDYRFRQYRPLEVQARADRAHNDFLNALADWGVAGVALIGCAWGLLALGVCKTWRYVRKAPRDLGGKPRSSKFAFVLGGALGLVAILCHSVVDFNMHIPANALVAVALMAMLSSHLRFATDQYWVTARPWAKVLGTLVLLAGLGYLGRESWRHTAENVWLARAARVGEFSTAQAELLQKAFAVEPRNAQTAGAIGEVYRVQSAEGDAGYQQLTAKAMEWFARSKQLNPWDGTSDLRYGWCLDWLDRSEESWPYFDRAEQLDPNSYFTMACIGLHYVKVGAYAAAKPWLERSLDLEKKDNLIAASYLELINRHLLAGATNELGATLYQPARAAHPSPSAKP